MILIEKKKIKKEKLKTLKKQCNHHISEKNQLTIKDFQ